MSRSRILSFVLVLACLNSCLCAYPFSYQTMPKSYAGICATGRQQSPINVQTSAVEEDPNLTLTLDFYGRNYPSHIIYQDNFGFMPNLMHMNMTMKHDTYQVVGPYGMVFAENANYDYLASDFKQVHLHSPSTNTINGQLHDVEVHFMFLTDLAEVAGLDLQRRVTQFAVFFDVDDSKPANPFITALNLANIGYTINLNFTQLVTNQIGTNPEFYFYEGSLDAAGCDEIIDYYIVKKPLTITTKQLNSIVNVLNGKNTGSAAQNNNRATQPLNGRVVKLGNTGKSNPSHQSNSGSSSQQSSHSGGH